MAEHNKVGKWGEQHAADVLDREGYTIVETNWSPPGSHRDIDIIAYTPRPYHNSLCRSENSVARRGFAT